MSALPSGLLAGTPVGGPLAVMLEGLVTYALHSTVLIGAVWVITRITPRAHHLHDGLWKIALAGGVITASVQMVWDIEPLGGVFPMTACVTDTTETVALREAPDPAAETATPSDAVRVEAARETETDAATGFATETIEAACSGRDRLAGLSSSEGTSGLGSRRVPSTGRSASTARSDPPAGRSRLERGVAAPRETRRIDRPVATMPPGGLSDRGTAARTTSELGLPGVPRWAAGVIGLWIGGALLLLVHRARQRHRLHRALGRRRPLDHDPTRRTFERLLRRAGIRRSVHLSAAPWLSSPVVLSGHEICLPERALRELGEREREAMLAHELAHIVRSDPQWLGLCDLLESVFYFQPANRVARRCWQRVSELLCDAWAVRQTGRGMTLARCLAQVASWMDPGGRAARVSDLSRGLAPGMAAKDSDLVRRVRRLLKEEETMKRNRSSALALLSCVALLGLVIWSAPRVLASPQEKGAVADEAPAAKIAAPAPAAATAPPAVRPQARGLAPVAVPAPQRPSRGFAVAAPALPATPAAAAPPLIGGSVPLLASPYNTSAPVARSFPAPLEPSAFAGPRRLGITPGKISEALAAHLGIDRGAAILVKQVAEGSPADRAGLETYDVIVRVNRKGNVTVDKLFGAIQAVAPGKALGLTVVRAGKPVEVEVTFDDAAGADAAPDVPGVTDDESYGVARFTRPPAGRAPRGRWDTTAQGRSRYWTGIGQRDEEGEALEEDEVFDEGESGELVELQERLGRFQERLEGLSERLEERLGKGTEMRANGLEEALEDWAARLEENLEVHGQDLEERIEARAHRIEQLFEEGQDRSEALEKLGPEIEALLEDLGPALHGLTDELGPALEELSEKLGPEIGEMIEELGPEIGAFSKELGPLIEELTKELGPEASRYVRALTGAPLRSFYRGAGKEDHSGAVDAYKRAVEQYGNWRSGLDSRAKAAMKQAEAAQKAAQEAYRQAMEQYQEAMKLLERLHENTDKADGTDSGRKKSKGRIL